MPQTSKSHHGITKQDYKSNDKNIRFMEVGHNDIKAINHQQAGQIVLYQPDENVSIEVKLSNDFKTVWLSIDQMAVLFGRDKSVVGKHVRAIFKEGELLKDSVWAKFAYTASDGKTYKVDFYNLDVIISVGYRVKSKQGTLFRIWATNILRNHLLQGYSINRQLIAMQERNDERFMQIEHRLDDQQRQVEFLVDMHHPHSIQRVVQRGFGKT